MASGDRGETPVARFVSVHRVQHPKLHDVVRSQVDFIGVPDANLQSRSQSCYLYV